MRYKVAITEKRVRAFLTMRHRRAAVDHLCGSAAGQAAGDELAHQGRVADSRADCRRARRLSPAHVLGGDERTTRATRRDFGVNSS